MGTTMESKLDEDTGKLNDVYMRDTTQAVTQLDSERQQNIMQDHNMGIN